MRRIAFSPGDAGVTSLLVQQTLRLRFLLVHGRRGCAPDRLRRRLVDVVERQRRKRRHVPGRLGERVRVHRQLRPDRRVPRRRVGAIYSNLLVRTLVGYNHVAGAGGQQARPRPRDLGAEPTDGGKTYTFHLKDGITFGPPVNRAVTSKDVRYAFERLAKPKNGGQYAFYYSRDRGLRRLRRRQGEDDLRHRDAGRADDRLPPDEADRRLPLPRWRCRRPGRSRRRSRSASRASPAQYGRDLVSTGPYMIEGADDVNASSCATLKPIERLRRPDAAHARPQPELRRERPTRRPRARASPTASSSTVNSNADDILEQGRGRRARGRGVEHPAADAAAVRRPSPT